MGHGNRIDAIIDNKHAISFNKFTSFSSFKFSSAFIFKAISIDFSALKFFQLNFYSHKLLEFQFISTL